MGQQERKNTHTPEVLVGCVAVELHGRVGGPVTQVSDAQDVERPGADLGGGGEGVDRGEALLLWGCWFMDNGS